MNETDEYVFGHKPLSGRRSVHARVKDIRLDPMTPLLDLLETSEQILLSNDISRYIDAYRHYHLSMTRILPEMSIARRYNDGPREVRKHGGKYTDGQRNLAKRYHQIAPYLELDLVNCIIHSRILMDRVAGLANRFLRQEPVRPSFSSFSDHKKFFMKLKTPYGKHEEYAEYIRTCTAWFDMPLKHVRDNYVVHLSPKHMRFLGSSGSGPDLQLCIIEATGGDLSRVKVVSLSPLQLSYDLQDFLVWFSTYGVKVVGQDS